MQRVPWSCKPCPNVCGCIHGKQAVANQFTPEILSGVEGYDRRRALPFSGIWLGTKLERSSKEGEQIKT